MLGSLIYCLSVTLLSLWFTECSGELSEDENALLEAARNHKWKETIELAKKGVNVDIQDVFNRSPLSYASGYLSDKTVVENLINFGVEHIVNAKMAKGEKGDKSHLIEIEAKKLVNKRYRKLPYQEGLRTVGNQGLPIYWAVAAGKKDIFDVLVKYGADPKKEKKLLHHSAKKCNKALARTLIDDYHFDVNGNDDYYETTPLHDAGTYNCDHEFMEIFTKKGADVNACDSKGETPLHKAVYKRSNIAVRALIDLGADLKKESRSGDTPLYFADGSPDIEKLLRDAINKADDSEKLHTDAHSTTTSDAHPKDPDAKAAAAKGNPNSELS